MKNQSIKAAIVALLMWSISITSCQQQEEVSPQSLSVPTTKIVKVEFVGYYAIVQLNDSTPMKLRIWENISRTTSIQYSGLDKVRVRAEVYNMSDTALRMDSLAKINVIVNNDTVEKIYSKGKYHAFLDGTY